MRPDEHLERAIQALLDGAPLPNPPEATGNGAAIPEPLCVVDAIARAHRTAIFGTDISPDRPVASRWGHLEIRGEIGRGASGTVYRAWDPKLAREVALKLLAPDAMESSDALAEGRLLARLNHPHIVRVFGADEHDGASGVWMELLEGETLDEILARDGVFSPEETLLIGVDLAGALSAVHAAGLLHRDVKARNILRERGGRIVLMDLGAGRAATTSEPAGDETGTPMYMAPEVLAGGGAATVRSDIYSLGVLLYRLLTRTYPFLASDVQQLRSAHATGARVALEAARPGLSASIVSVVERACHPDAESRFASAADMEQALVDALRRTVSERAAVASAMTRRWRQWRRTIGLTGATAALTLLTTWGAWETTQVRSIRRLIGLPVPPRSTLYLTMNGAVGIVRSRGMTVVAYNPGIASPIAVSEDLGIRTMTGMPPWGTGGAFRLDGKAIAAPPTLGPGLCCFYDGTTDGRFNYSARQDSTLTDAIGSRPLAPAALYRFTRDWSNPEQLFLLDGDGIYHGVTYAAASDTFWLTKNAHGAAIIEQWNRDGKHVSTPVRLSAAAFTGIAADPRDGTLWVARQLMATELIHLENFDVSGHHLGTVDVKLPSAVPWGAGGAEFGWMQDR